MTHSPSSSARRQRLTALIVATAVVSGCQGGSPFSPTGRAADEGRISTDAWGNVNIAVGGRNFRIKAADLRPLPDVSIQAGGKFYSMREGRFAMPENALRDLKENSRAFFRVFVPGYVPKQVWIGQAEDDITVSPVKTVAVAMAMSQLGGELKARDGSVSIGVPGGMLDKPTTKVALSTYQPEIRPEETEAAVAARNDFLSKVKAKAGKSYALAQASNCEAPDAPLPCPPPTESLGMMLTVDGPLKPGQMTAAMDLSVLMRGWDGQGQPPWAGNAPGWTPEQIAQARAADKLLRTFKKIQQDPDGRAYQEVLASDYGVRVEGTRILFSVNVGVDNTVDGFVRTDVEGVSLLGVKLEFTAVSSLNQALPQSALPPAMQNVGAGAGAAAAAQQLATNASNLIGMDGASLIGLDGASLIGMDGASIMGQQTATLIGMDGASLIGMDGGSLIGLDAASLVGMDAASLIGMDAASLIGADGASLIGNDGGSLVGGVQVPFAPNQAKYQLQAYTEHVWGSGTVRAIGWDGTTVYSTDVPIQEAGWFAMNKLPPTLPFFIVEATVGPYKLYGLAIAPGKKVTSVRVDAATTVVVAGMWKAYREGKLDLAKIGLPRYNHLVGLARTKLVQKQAQDAVTPATAVGVHPTQPAIDVGGLLGLLSAVVGILIPPPPAPPAPPGATPPPTYPTGAVPSALAGTRSTFLSGLPKVFGVVQDSNNQFVLATEAGVTQRFNGSGNANGNPMFSIQDSGVYRHLATDGTYAYVADYANSRIVRKDIGNGGFSVYATLPDKPTGVVRAADGTLYVSLDNANAIYKITGPGAVQLVPAATGLNKPLGLALDAAGTTLYIADSQNHAIKALDLGTNMITKIAGAGTQGAVDHASPLSATFDTPHAVAVAPNGYVFVADWNNHSIRYVMPGGAGVGTLCNSGLNKPTGLIWVEANGNKPDYLLVADYDNNALQEIKIQ